MGLPSDLEDYVEESIAYTVGLPVSEEALKLRLYQAEVAQKELRQQLYSLQQRLGDTQQKLSRTKVEANLNAQAVRRHIEENQKIAEQWRKACDECTRLEKECALYHHDREVFMEAADEAEERAQNAEEEAFQAHNRIQQLLSEIENLKHAHGGTNSSPGSKTKAEEELNMLRCRVKELESANRSLQGGAAPLKKRREDSSLSRRIEQLEKDNRQLRTLLEVANSRIKGHPNGLQNLKQGAGEGDQEDKLHIYSVLSSAVGKGLYKATEEEKQEVVTNICSNMEAFKEELCGRIESEKSYQMLLAEVQSLRQERNHIKSNLEKAEVEVQLLDDENKELRLLLKGRMQGSEGHAASPLQSPLQLKVKASSCSPKSKVISPENNCELHGNDTFRQPLSPLAHNSVESKMYHR